MYFNYWLVDYRNTFCSWHTVLCSLVPQNHHWRISLHHDCCHPPFNNWAGPKPLILELKTQWCYGCIKSPLSTMRHLFIQKFRPSLVLGVMEKFKLSCSNSRFKLCESSYYCELQHQDQPNTQQHHLHLHLHTPAPQQPTHSITALNRLPTNSKGSSLLVHANRSDKRSLFDFGWPG